MAEEKKKVASGKMLKITQVKSIIRAHKKQKATILALKLGRPNYFVTLSDNAKLQGQLRAVAHLIKVE
jgi:large subunit ribosomal protein L30